MLGKGEEGGDTQPAAGACKSGDDEDKTSEQSQRVSKQFKSRPRTILSREQVLEIYEHKKSMGSASRTTAPSADLARKYHVSSKTIRDIWNGRCWQETTLHLRKQVPLFKLSAFAKTFSVCLLFFLAAR
jgi:hypothetical protein